MSLPVTPPLNDLHALAALLQTAFFQPWLTHGLYMKRSAEMLKDPKQKKGRKCCDYAIFFGNQAILIDVHQGVFDAYSDIALEWDLFRKIALPNSRKRLARLESALASTLLYTDENCEQPLIAQPEKIYKLCITAAFEQLGSQYAAILHSYGADFYIEKFVQDEEENPLLVYSLGDFSVLVSQLNSFPDLFDFLAEHQLLIQQLDADYVSELGLLEHYIEQGRPFAQARTHEYQWVAQGLKREYSPLLEQASHQPTQVFQHLREQAVLWQTLVSRYAQQALAAHGDEQIERLALLDLLADESIWSQAQLSLAMMNQYALAASRADDGYVVHLRSYRHPKRHYVLLFYAESPKHTYSRDRMVSKLPELASQVNAMEQAPMLDDIMVIGLTSRQGQFVAADIAHMIGRFVPESQRPVRAQEQFDGMRVNQAESSPRRMGRNDPCFCGSGRRYKHCCGSAQRAARLMGDLGSAQT
ncbi:MAG: SEC-C domain-containing protein [Pseudomonadota bacterium]|nr:SEC-C domain-containing protein [Pseudomonadota bacterium]